MGGEEPQNPVVIPEMQGEGPAVRNSQGKGDVSYPDICVQALLICKSTHSVVMIF